MNLVLVSYNICPYSLRVMATLIHKKIPFDTQYVDIDNLPEWFLEISPLHKVPILIVGEDVIFESNVIISYVDSIQEPTIQSQGILRQSVMRGRAEFANELLTVLTTTVTAPNEYQFKQGITNIQWYFTKMEEWLIETMFLDGNELQLVDLAFAPIFVIINSLKQISQLLYIGFKRVKQYGEQLLKVPAVQQAKHPDYENLVRQRVQSYKGYMNCN